MKKKLVAALAIVSLVLLTSCSSVGSCGGSCAVYSTGCCTTTVPVCNTCSYMY